MPHSEYNNSNTPADNDLIISQISRNKSEIDLNKTRKLFLQILGIMILIISLCIFISTVCAVYDAFRSPQQAHYDNVSTRSKK